VALEEEIQGFTQDEWSGGKHMMNIAGGWAEKKKKKSDCRKQQQCHKTKLWNEGRRSFRMFLTHRKTVQKA